MDDEDDVDLAELVPELVDLEAWRRYCAVLQVFKLYGKIWEGWEGKGMQQRWSSRALGSLSWSCLE